VKRLLAPLLLIVLAACAPAQVASDKPDPTPPKLTWVAAADLHTLTFQPGEKPAQRATLLITGEKLQVNPAELKANGGRCEVTAVDVACLLGDVAAGAKPSVIVKGPAKLASVLYGREGTRFVVVARPPAP
jgi:hypothetical protein